MRALTADLSPDAVAAVQTALAGVRRDHGVRIPLAVESGSRAWGFPSPDSDYDVRFVFVRSVEQHLTPWPSRDVIEPPVSGELDISGWDLRKALALLLKGNAVAIEWLTSPIVYGVEPWFREALLDFAGRFTRREAVARHYLHLGLRQARVHLDGRAEVRLKQLFYALRPAAALRWLRLHPGAVVAPMHFPTLMAECEPPEEVAAAVGELVARKAATRELGVGRAPEAVLAFIRAEFEAGAGLVGEGAVGPDAGAREAARGLYAGIVRRLEGG